MQKQMTLRRTVMIVAIASLVATVSVVVAVAQSSDGCDKNVAPIAESNEFTSNEVVRTHLPDYPITMFGEARSSSARNIDRLPLQWEVADGPRSSYQYFLASEMTPQLTVPAFRAAGGIQLDRDLVTDGGPYTADDVIAQVGQRAVKVQIGNYEGALVWADPESNGARPHHLYWSDGTYNYALIAVRDAERMVQLGRELVCGG